MWSSLFLIKVKFFLPQTAQFDKFINLFCVVFLASDTICFHCFYVVYSGGFSGHFITSFISLYYLNALFAETNSSWLIWESIKKGALEIRTSIVSSLLIVSITFPNNSILSSFIFFFLLIIDMYFLIPTVIAEIVNPSGELTIPTRRRSDEANAAIEIQLLKLK